MKFFLIYTAIGLFLAFLVTVSYDIGYYFGKVYVAKEVMRIIEEEKSNNQSYTPYDYEWEA